MKDFISQYIIQSRPELALKPWEMPAQQQRMLNQTLLAFDGLKEIYLTLARGYKLKATPWLL